MIRPRRLLLAFVPMVWVCIGLGCGAGQKPEQRSETRGEGTKPKAESKTEHRGQQPALKVDSLVVEIEPKVDSDAEQREQETRDRKRREELRKNKPDEDVKRAKESRLRARNRDSMRLRNWGSPDSSSSVRRKAQRQLKATRLTATEARVEYAATIETFPDTLAAQDAEISSPASDQPIDRYSRTRMGPRRSQQNDWRTHPTALISLSWRSGAIYCNKSLRP